MVEIKQNLCSELKYGIKCPYSMTPTRIVIHNTANDASAQNEISYMIGNNLEVSFHYAVDDVEIVQGIPLDRNAWHAGDGNGKGNREGIAIEICYSKSGGDKFAKAQENAAELTAKLLKDYGWDISRVTKHEDYANKHCPHRTLDEYGWDYFISLVNKYLNGISEQPIIQQPVVEQPNPTVTYAVHTLNGSWLPNVVDYNEQNADGYAGIIGKSADGIRATLNSGHIVYRTHLIGGSYLAWVKDHDASQNGYAGIYGKSIDGIQMYLEDLPGFAVEYRVSPVGKGYLPWVRNYDNTANGYAGIYGKAFDRLQIRIVKL